MKPFYLKSLDLLDILGCLLHLQQMPACVQRGKGPRSKEWHMNGLCQLQHVDQPPHLCSLFFASPAAKKGHVTQSGQGGIKRPLGETWSRTWHRGSPLYTWGLVIAAVVVIINFIRTFSLPLLFILCPTGCKPGLVWISSHNLIACLSS